MTYLAFLVKPEERVCPDEHLTVLYHSADGFMPPRHFMAMVSEARELLPLMAVVSNFCRVTVDGQDQTAWKIDVPHELHVLRHRYSEWAGGPWTDWRPHITPGPSTHIQLRLPGSTVNFTNLKYKP